MTLLSDDIRAYVDQAVAKQIAAVRTAVGTVVTSPSQVSTDALTVVVDGGAVAVPVKGFRALPIFPGARVALAKFGSDWTIVGAYTNPGAGTGSSRMAIGSDVPAELRSYGIDTAILTYITDKNTGLEVGYFFIGGSNRFDGGASDNRVQAFGNVVYPTPGVPSSATSGNVKTNFQQNMFAPYPQTVFKDQSVRFWTSVSMEVQNGFQNLRVGDSIGNLAVHVDGGGVFAGHPSSTNTETWQAATLTNGWGNVGGVHVTAQYRRIASPPNTTECVGTISGGTNTNGTSIFTLATGYRPANTHRRVVYAFGGTLNIATEMCSVDIASDGTVKLLADVNATVLSYHFFVPLDA